MNLQSSHATIHVPHPMVLESALGPDSERRPENRAKAARIYDRYTHVLSLQRQVSSLQRLAIFRQGQVAKAHGAVARARKEWLEACAAVGRMLPEDRRDSVARLEAAQRRYDRKKDLRDRLTTPASQMWTHHAATAEAQTNLRRARGQLTLNPTSVNLQHRFLTAQIRHLEAQRAKLMTQLRMEPNPEREPIGRAG